MGITLNIILADDLDNVVTPSGLQGAYDVYRQCLNYFESLEETPPRPIRELREGCPRLTCKGEPQLGKRGLYDFGQRVLRMTDFSYSAIAYCDGTKHSLRYCTYLKL